MKARLGRNWKELVFFPLLMLVITYCVDKETGKPDGDPTASTPDCTQSTPANMMNPSVDCPALPDSPQLYNPTGTAYPPSHNSTLVVNATSFENFAWKAFVALNWPAGFFPRYRGFPNTSLSFADANSTQVTVWETWKEKREIFFYGDNLSAPPTPNPPKPKPWNAPIDYMNVNESIPPCDGREADVERIRAEIAALGGEGRFFLQSIKTGSLDESVEVPSEANPALPPPEGGSLSEPRVYKRVGSDIYPVLFEVKLNFDYFDYVVSNELYKDTVKSAKARLNGNFSVASTGGQGTIAFPARCTDVPGEEPCKKGRHIEPYNVTQVAQNGLNPNNTPNNEPVRTGTIQTKSGWIQSRALDSSTLDTYHRAPALFYREQGSGICVDGDEFALLGLHIIQKTKVQGFYVYGTWEHKDNDDLGLLYRNFFYDPAQKGYVPGVEQNVQRLHPILQSTIDTNTAFQGKITGVWKNYQLIGTQFLPLDINYLNPSCAAAPQPGPDCNQPALPGRSSPAVPGLPFYLANLVVETNWGLQNFQGVPPGSRQTGQPKSTQPPYDPTDGFLHDFAGPSTFTNVSRAYQPYEGTAFNRTLVNLGRGRNFNTTSPFNPNGNPSLYGGMFNMGGCMGCHGIAQANGTDFSFVLLKGQVGAKPETADGIPDE